MTNLVEIKNLAYKMGPKKIFTDLNLTLEQGKIIALLGENGAGKTTLIRILAGFNKRMQGNILSNGQTLGVRTKAQVSFLDELKDFKKSDRLGQIIRFYKRLYPDFDSEKAAELMAFMALDEKAKLGSLSTGNRQKFSLVVTLSRKAKLYLLDEPLSGVDILAREKIIRAMIQWFDEESSILISTHHIGEMDTITDDVIVLKNQVIIDHASADDIRAVYGKDLESYYREIYGTGDLNNENISKFDD
jgi:ABC-2 type transport system ATP-binding protein